MKVVKFSTLTLLRSNYQNIGDGCGSGSGWGGTGGYGSGCGECNGFGLGDGMGGRPNQNDIQTYEVTNDSL